MSAAELEANKALVERFIREVAIGGNLSAIDELVTEDYVQNPAGSGHGREAARRYFDDFNRMLKAGAGPKDVLEVSVVADGDFVVRQAVHRNGMLVEVFRLRDGRLAEQWSAWRPAEGFEPLAGF